MIRDILLFILTILLLTTLVIILRTLIYRRRHPPITTIEGIPVDPQEIAEHLASAVRCKTVPSG